LHFNIHESRITFHVSRFTPLHIMNPSPSQRRSARRAQRAESPLLKVPFRQPRNPWPPLEVITPDEVERLHRASLHILENVGLNFQDAEALDLWARAGAQVNFKEQRAWLDGGLVMELVKKAPPSFTWRARNPAHNVRIGGDAIAFGPNGGMVYVSDLERGRRNGTLADYEDFVRVAQMAGVLHFAAWEQVAAMDVPPSFRHLRRLYAAFTLADKAVMEGALGRVITNDCLEMARIVFGDLEAGPGEPCSPVIGDVINASSPLRFDERMLGGLITYARAGQVIYVTPFILAGAMSPITIAAALAQQNAEALAGVALAQLVRPGAPVLMGGFTTNVDMKSGGPAFGTPEGAWAMSIGAQLARYYGLPYRGSGSLTTSKLPDAQAAWETMWTLWPAVLSHNNLIMHAAGWLEGGLTASGEKFIIDLESLAMFQHFLNGFEINDDTLALDMIAEVGPGGHHFGTPHTQARYSTEFYNSFLTDRQGYENWVAAGSQDAAQRAHAVWKDLLAHYEQPPLDPGIQAALADFVKRREKELEGVNLYE
jgi:trimethylamine--corrinoid protein Co-methyltransferase